MRMQWIAALVVAVLAGGCGNRTPTLMPDAKVQQPDGPRPDGLLPASDARLGDAKAKADGKPGVDLGAACAVEIATLAGEMYAKPAESCTAVLRLDYTTLAVLGFQLLCGGYGGVTEAQARASAQKDTGHGTSGKMLNAASPGDEYVFFQGAGDFGGSAAVSARTGLSVFGGSTIWMGTGEITYPKTWRPASGLGAGCPAAGGIPTSQGYDLENGQTLPKLDVDKAVAVAAQTALPAAMWLGGYVFDAVVLRYPRSVGMFEPSNAEWIVLLNGGWLE